MRNISQYPITADEVLRVLNKIPEVNPEGTPPSRLMIGGINDMIRRGIIAFLSQDDHMAELLDSFRRE